jgi:hypothetical protein
MTKYNGIYKTGERYFSWSGRNPNGSYENIYIEDIGETFSIEYVKVDVNDHYDHYKVIYKDQIVTGAISHGYDVSTYMGIVKIEEEEVIC